MIGKSLATYLTRLKKEQHLSYHAIATLAEVDCRTVRDFLKQIPTRCSYVRGVRLEVADRLIKACGGTWEEFIKERGE